MDKIMETKNAQAWRFWGRREGVYKTFVLWRRKMAVLDRFGIICGKGLKLASDIGLMLEFDLNQDPNDTCCEYGGKKIRWVESSDAGKSKDEVPCLLKRDTRGFKVSEDALKSSIEDTEDGEHNEWILKPPHRVIGLFINSSNPQIYVGKVWEDRFGLSETPLAIKNGSELAVI